MNRHFGNILVVDNDVLVYLFKNNYDIQPQIVDKVINSVALSYSTIWIPTIVMNEFKLGEDNKQRVKRLNRIFEEYNFIHECPITIGIHEIELLVGNRSENAGEADALLQIQKARSSENHTFSSIKFLTNDKGAIKLAENLNISTLSYIDFKNQFKEIGISLV